LDVDLRNAISEGLIPGPRMQVTTEGMRGSTAGPRYRCHHDRGRGQRRDGAYFDGPRRRRAPDTRRSLNFIACKPLVAGGRDLPDEPWGAPVSQVGGRSDIQRGDYRHATTVEELAAWRELAWRDEVSPAQKVFQRGLEWRYQRSSGSTAPQFFAVWRKSRRYG
jgi:hypothetical protein